MSISEQLNKIDKVKDIIGAYSPQNLRSHYGRLEKYPAKYTVKGRGEILCILTYSSCDIKIDGKNANFIINSKNGFYVYSSMIFKDKDHLGDTMFGYGREYTPVTEPIKFNNGFEISLKANQSNYPFTVVYYSY